MDSLIVILNDKLMEVMGDDACVDDCFKEADNVLRNAVGGIVEIIGSPGLINVDFEDVRTVMGEMGMAMMGSATSSGVDRARLAAEKAVASPLLEGVNLTGARGVLVNITATKGFRMKEVNEVMNTVRVFAAEDAHIIFGAVYDENMGEDIRVTVVATGLGKQSAVRQPFKVIMEEEVKRTGTDNMPIHSGVVDYDAYDSPAFLRPNQKRTTARVDALTKSGVDQYDIPAFLRRQAD